MLCDNGSLPLNISWTHSLNPMTFHSTTITSYKDNSTNLIINSVGDSDFGKYTCKAWNEIGSNNKTITLFKAGKCLY